MDTTDTTIHAGDAAQLLLTVEQAAARIGVGRTTMFALIGSGDVRTVQIGRLRRIRPADLQTYVDGLASSEAA